MKVWQRYFTPLNALYLGIGGDQVENVLWRAKNLVIPQSLTNVVVIFGTNNLFTDSTMDIATVLSTSAPVCMKNPAVSTVSFVGSS